VSIHIDELATLVEAQLGERVRRYAAPAGELAYELAAPQLLEVALALRDTPGLAFESLMDVAGVDYLDYGQADWNTSTATSTGFSRGVNPDVGHTLRGERRYAVVYQLQSVSKNQRVRLRVWCDGAEEPTVESLCGVWASANWFEREAFDLFGILFTNHPDLRRLLTDYGFIGHPFRKDFPLIGNVEVRYDEAQQRVIYEPVTIEPRILVPRVIRHDNRYDPALLAGEKRNG
jgi:NADH-quinone oxidoreductase subunit C